MNEKYIFVNNKKVYVSDEVYRIYKQQQNREQYLVKKSNIFDTKPII